MADPSVHSQCSPSAEGNSYEPNGHTNKQNIVIVRGPVKEGGSQGRALGMGVRRAALRQSIHCWGCQNQVPQTGGSYTAEINFLTSLRSGAGALASSEAASWVAGGRLLPVSHTASPPCVSCPNFLFF